MGLRLSNNVHYKYEDFQPLITCTGTATVFPTPVATAGNPATSSGAKQPDNIFVQAHPSNTTNIYIGKSNVAANGSAGGYLLAPGANMSLPGKEYANYYHIAASASPQLLVTYQRGPL